MSEINIAQIDRLVGDELLDSYDLLAYLQEIEARSETKQRKLDMRSKIEEDPNEVNELFNVYEEITLALNKPDIESDVIEKRNEIKLIVGAAPWQVLLQDINGMHQVICDSIGVDMHEVKRAI